MINIVKEKLRLSQMRREYLRNFRTADRRAILELLNIIDDTAQEYELDNPNYSQKLREFENEKIREINNLIEQIYDKVEELENYTSYVEK